MKAISYGSHITLCLLLCCILSTARSDDRQSKVRAADGLPWRELTPVVKSYLEAWSKEDFDKMYSLLSQKLKDSLSPADFRECFALRWPDRSETKYLHPVAFTIKPDPDPDSISLSNGKQYVEVQLEFTWESLLGRPSLRDLSFEDRLYLVFELNQDSPLVNCYTFLYSVRLDLASGTFMRLVTQSSKPSRRITEKMHKSPRIKVDGDVKSANQQLGFVLHRKARAAVNMYYALNVTYEPSGFRIANAVIPVSDMKSDDRRAPVPADDAEALSVVKRYLASWTRRDLRSMYEVVGQDVSFAQFQEAFQLAVGKSPAHVFAPTNAEIRAWTRRDDAMLVALQLDFSWQSAFGKASRADLKTIPSISELLGRIDEQHYQWKHNKQEAARLPKQDTSAIDQFFNLPNSQWLTKVFSTKPVVQLSAPQVFLTTYGEYGDAPNSWRRSPVDFSSLAKLDFYAMLWGVGLTPSQLEIQWVGKGALLSVPELCLRPQSYWCLNLGILKLVKREGRWRIVDALVPQQMPGK